MSAVIARATAFATQAHKGQTRKYSGEPYVEHPKRVASAFDTDEVLLRTVALLHDTLEDTDTTYEQLETEFGKDVADLVKILTREPGEGYFQYLYDVGGSPEASRVKLADLYDNMSDLPAKEESLRRRYQRALVLISNIQENRDGQGTRQV